jgi:hypothetical protein
MVVPSAAVVRSPAAWLLRNGLACQVEGMALETEG